MTTAARIILVTALLAALVAAYIHVQNEEQQPAARPADEAAKIADQIRNLPEAPESWILLETAPDEMNLEEIADIQDEVRNLANSATRRIVFESYFARKNWGKAAKRVNEAASSGLSVLGVLHRNPMNDAPFLDDLRAAGAHIFERDIAAAGGNPKEGYIHAKFFVADGRRGYVGSANYSAAGMRENREMGILFDDESIAQSLEMIAAFDAGQVSSCRTPAIRSAVLAQGAPDGLEADGLPRVDDCVAALCAMAKHEIDIMMFTFSHKFGNYSAIASPVRAAVRRGVRVRLIHEERTVADLQGVFPTLKDMKQWGVEVRVADISTLGKYPDGQYHAKAMRVDDEFIMVGSNNWTDAAARENREIAIVTRSRRMTAAFKTRFNADWNMSGYVKPFTAGNS